MQYVVLQVTYNQTVHSGVEQRIQKYCIPHHNFSQVIALCIDFIITLRIGGSPLYCLGELNH